MQKFQINLGKTLPAFRGEWDKDTQYDYNDIVTRYESSYVYKVKGATANKDPYKTPTDEHGELYWGLLAGRGVKGAKWYVGTGKIDPINLQGRTEQDEVSYYTIDDIDQATGAEVSEIALIGDYYLAVNTGTIYMCVYPGGADKEGNIGNEAAIWRYATDFSWMEMYKYFFINTEDIQAYIDPDTEQSYLGIKRYYVYEDNSQSGDELIMIDLTDQQEDNRINIDSSRFNCYLYGQVGIPEEPGQIPPIEPIASAGNISWNNIREIIFEEKEMRVIQDSYLQDIWILVEQFSIAQTTSSFTFDTMRVAAVTKNWNEDATVTTGTVSEEGIKHPLMTFGIPRGRPFIIKKIYDTAPTTNEDSDWIFEKYDIVLGKTTVIEDQQEITAYYLFYNNGEGVGYTPVWVNMGIFNYAAQAKYENKIVYSDGWKADIDTNFPYTYTLELPNLQEDMVPQVVFDAETAIKQRISPVATILKDDNNQVVLKIYAAKVPSTDITIQTIICTLPPSVEIINENVGD